MARILVIRFSAMGDVLMTVPVVHALATQYPQHQITVLSKKRMAVYFSSLPENVTFLGIDLNDYKGLTGLYRLYVHHLKGKFDYVADFHDVIRTKVERLFFQVCGIPVRHIHKGRIEKRALVRQRNKKKIPLKSSFQRYADVLARLGFPIVLENTPVTVKEASGKNRIGVAPFAAHAGKIYPLEKMQEVVRLLAALPRTQVYLFGGGNREREVLEEWERAIPNVESVVGKLSQQDELELIGELQMMVCMDSANMHLASLKKIPAVSIWGATHPYAGFLGWRQSAANAMGVDLPCRPCSIFGNKPCLRGDYACLNQITPQQIVEHVKKMLE